MLSCMGAGTWPLTELDEDEDTAFGLCDLGRVFLNYAAC